MICAIDNCNKRAWYNFAGLDPIVCCSHRGSEMINVVQKLCVYPGCKARASFGKDKVKTHCSKHKEDDSVNNNRRLCECGSQATYGFEGCQPISCALHAGFMHINLVTPTCSEKGCYLKALYRVPGQTKEYYCKNHKTQDMTDFKARCECGKQASFGYPGGAKQCCKAHSLEGMINIKHYDAKAKKFSAA